MELVETMIEDARWEGLGLPAVAERAARAALEGVGLRPAGFLVSLMGCDDARIAVLNADFRGNTAEPWTRATNYLVRNRLLAPNYGKPPP